jgi:pyrroloquinoline quinone biosynthesis protein E
MKDLKFPKPSPAKEYNETISKGLELFPQREENYKKYKAFKKDSANVDFLPIKMDIENVSRCNLSCQMCQVITFEGQKRAEDLSLEDFKNIIDEQIGLVEIKLQGLGEPLLQKEFFEMVKYATSKSIWVRSTTNATLLHKKDNYKKLVDCGIGEVQISVDGATKESYESIRHKSNFELVKENCKLINDYCDLKGVDKTRMWCLLQKENLKDLFDIPYLAKELGFKRATISLDVNGWGNDEWEDINSKKKVSTLVTQDDIDKLLKIAEEIDLDLTFWDITSKYTKDNICSWPFERAFVSSDKKVVPCCMIGNPDVLTLGEYDDFKEIWYGKVYNDFRQTHIDFNIIDICKYCYSFKE